MIIYTHIIHQICVPENIKDNLRRYLLMPLPIGLTAQDRHLPLQCHAPPTEAMSLS